MPQISVDFTGTDTEGGAVHVPPGYYKMRLLKATPGQAKGGNRGPVIVTDWLIGGTNKRMRKSISLAPAALWKLRAMLIALGYEIKPVKLKLDPDKWRGRECGALLVDNSYLKDGVRKVASDIEEFVTLAELEALKIPQTEPKSIGAAQADLEEALAEIEASEDGTGEEDGLVLGDEEEGEIEEIDPDDLPF